MSSPGRIPIFTVRLYFPVHCLQHGRDCLALWVSFFLNFVCIQVGHSRHTKRSTEHGISATSRQCVSGVSIERAHSRLIPTVSFPSVFRGLTRKMLEQVGSTDDGDGRRRPWELRSVLHAAFRDLVEESRRKGSRGSQHQYLASCSRLQDGGIRDSMEGAIELRQE